MYSARPNNDQEKETFLATKRHEREREKRERFLGGRVEYPKQFSASNFSPIRKQRYLWGKFHTFTSAHLIPAAAFRERERERERVKSVSEKK